MKGEEEDLYNSTEHKYRESLKDFRDRGSWQSRLRHTFSHCCLTVAKKSPRTHKTVFAHIPAKPVSSPCHLLPLTAGFSLPLRAGPIGFRPEDWTGQINPDRRSVLLSLDGLSVGNAIYMLMRRLCVFCSLL